MLASLQNATTQPLPDSPETPRNSVNLNTPKVEGDKVFPVDEIKTPDQIFDYLDQLMEALQQEQGKTDNLSKVDDVPPQVQLPELPCLLPEEKIDFRPPVPLTPTQQQQQKKEEREREVDEEDEKRRETEEVVAYLDQLERELEGDLEEESVHNFTARELIPQVMVGDFTLPPLETLPNRVLENAWDAWSNSTLVNSYSDDMPSLEKVSDTESEDYSDMPPLVSVSEEDKEELDTDEIFGSREPLLPPLEEETAVDSKENFGWSDFNVEDYLTKVENPQPVEMTEIVVESPQSPVSPALVVRTEVRHRRRRLFKATRRVRPPTPYARRDAVSDDGDTLSESRNKRCKLENDEEVLEVSAHTSDILNRLEQGEVLPDQDSIFNTVRVVRKRPAPSPVSCEMPEVPEISPSQARSAPPNKFQSLLDRLCPSDQEGVSDDDFDDESGSSMSISSSSSEDEPVIQAICNEFAELAESVTQLFRRCQ
jgi:hypothetical protein